MRRAWIALLATALVATACAGDDDSASETTATPTTAAPTTAAPTTAPPTTAAPTTTASTAAETEDTVASGDAVTVAASDLGDILVDADGNTLYLFVPDAQGESVCYDQCEDAWPPLTGDVSAGEGVDASLLGTTERTDGSIQVTYNDWPLYYFAADNAPGDTNGQGVNDVWWVVDPAGEAVDQG